MNRIDYDDMIVTLHISTLSIFYNYGPICSIQKKREKLLQTKTTVQTITEKYRQEIFSRLVRYIFDTFYQLKTHFHGCLPDTIHFPYVILTKDTELHVHCDTLIVEITY